MMEYKPLDEISVVALTKLTNVNRQTFYYHFQNIYDLLTYIFLNEKITDVEKTQTNSEVLEIVFAYVDQNYNLFKNTAFSAGKDLLIEFFYNIFYNSTLRNIAGLSQKKPYNIEDAKLIARFLGYGYSNIVVSYLEKDEDDYSPLLEKAKSFFSSYELVSMKELLN